jgi:hypothetical protein
VPATVIPSIARDQADRFRLSAISGGAGGAPCCMVKFGNGEEQLEFEVNNQSYFLNFVEDEGLWYVFRPTGTGVIRIPVEMEAVHSEHFAFAPESGKKRVVH